MRYGNPSKKTRIVSSTKGHAIEFPGKGSVDPKSVPAPVKGQEDSATIVASDGVVFVYVPPVMRGEVANQGLLPESEIEESDAPKVVTKPEDAEKLKELAFGAFEILVAAADRETFAGNGFPKPNAVEKLLGFTLTNGEVKDFWNKYMVEKKDGGS